MMDLYLKGVEELKTNGIPNRIYKKIRTEMLGCSDDTEYLAKMYCLRLAFEKIMSNSDDRTWYEHKNWKRNFFF